MGGGRKEEKGSRGEGGRGGGQGACALLLLLLIYIAPHTVSDQLRLFIFLPLIWHIVKNKTCFEMFSRSNRKELLAVIAFGEGSSAGLLGAGGFRFFFGIFLY